MELVKNEYTETERLVKMVKREENIYPKTESLYPNVTAYYNPYNPYPLNFRQMSFPWVATNIPYSYLLYNLNSQPLYVAKHQVKKPFLILKDLKVKKTVSNLTTSTPSVKSEETIEVKVTAKKSNKKKFIRVSACKNYIGLLCAGFSRTLLTADNGSEVLNYIRELLNQRKTKYESLQNLFDEDLVDVFKRYIYKTMCGKKVKKSNRERDFKIRNTEELDDLLISKESDNEITCLKKEVLKEMVIYFFNSDCYAQWLSKGMMSESNRFFFMNNKEEIQKKFLNPSTYKPRFNHGSSLDL